MRLHPNLATVYRQKVAHLQDLLANKDTQTEAVQVLRSLVDQVVLQPKDGALEVELIGDIAKMVLVAQQNLNNSPPSRAVHDEFARSVKVVAGTRFELMTFRL